MGGLFAQCLLDGLLLTLCGVGFFGRKRGRWDLLLSLVYAVLCYVLRMYFCNSDNPMDYILLPVNHLLVVVLLLVPTMPVNSGWFRVGERTIFWGTMAQFALYLLLRESCLMLLAVMELEEIAAVYGVRVLSMLFWVALASSGLFRWLRDRLAEGDIAVEAVSCATLLILLLLWQFQMGWNGLWLGAVALLAALLVLDGGLLLWEQRRIREQQRTRLLEQYLPMVEELVESVRARQHEFNNRMMAVSAAVSTADSLEDAQRAVAALTGGIALNRVDRELLKCDSKVISGMLFGKIKQAELRHIKVEIDLSGSFLRRSLPESDWVEIIGVLLDNALEASAPDDTIYLQSEDQDGALRFTVSNPCPPKSNTELAEMFRRGWSTKAEQGRGYGLFNVRQMVERRGGRLVVRNEDMDERNYLTIGAIIL